MKLYFFLFLYCNTSIYTNGYIHLPNYETITAFFNSNTQNPPHDKIIQEIAEQKLSKADLLKIFNKYDKKSIEKNKMMIENLILFANSLKKYPSFTIPSSSIPRFKNEDQSPFKDSTEEWEII